MPMIIDNCVSHDRLTADGRVAQGRTICPDQTVRDLALEQIDLDQIQDVAQAKRAIVLLFNLVEDLQVTIRELQAENQRLRDENNRLKGEQGKPNFKPNRRGKPPVRPRSLVGGRTPQTAGLA